MCVAKIAWVWGSGVELADPLMSLQPRDPRRIGPYRIVGRLGEGGMGVVFAGIDGPTKAAVKVIRGEHAADPQFRGRFRREVALVSRVQGACVARFLSADTEAELPWLATTYVPGPTLSTHVTQSGPLRGSALTSLATGIAEALAVIHRAGVVHRDLKPGNVIVSPEGPKILDFGIARAFDGTAITVTNAFVGSFGWASPEQYRGLEIGPASDVYSWGAVIAYAATGRPPFGTGSLEVMAYRVLQESPDLEGVPEPLVDLVASALSKDPADRPTVASLIGTLTGNSGGAADDVTQIATQIIADGWGPLASLLPAPASWPRSRRPSHRALAISGAGLILALSLGVLGSAGLPAISSAGPTRSPVTSSPARSANDRVSPVAPSVSVPARTQTSATSETATPTFSPPPEWNRATVSGVSFYAPPDWTNGLADLPPDPSYLCLLPSGVTPAGMAMCRGDALTFSKNAATDAGPTSEAEWRQALGLSLGWGNTGNPSQIPGYFTKQGLAPVGDHKADYREFMVTLSDGTATKVRAWWLPATKLWICSTVDPRYDVIVDHILATVHFS